MSVEAASQYLEGESMPERDQKKEKAIAFVRDNMFKRPEGESNLKKTPRCVDGGYTKEQVTEHGDSFARPGADGGYVEALLKVAKDNAIPLSGKEAVDIIATIVDGFGRKFYNHTDTHALHHNHDVAHGDKEIGCGHEAKAVAFASEYGVDATAMQEVINTIVSEQIPAVNTVLDREHTEDAVLVVKGSTYSIAPWNGEKTEMNFVYDADIDAEVMGEIWKQVQKDSRFSGIDFSAFKGAADLQTGVTVEKLATSKGKPTYVVEFSESGEPTLTSA